MSHVRLWTRRRWLGQAALATLFGLVAVLPWRLAADENKPCPEARDASFHNLKTMLLAMHSYHDAAGSLPPAVLASHGQLMLSWRVLLLPYLDEGKLYAEFHLDEPWDSPHNAKLVGRMPAVYRSPASKLDNGRTVYLTPRGAETAFPGEATVTLRDVTDGLASTIAIVEVNDERAVPWTKPVDWEFDRRRPKVDLGQQFEGGFLAAFVDGSAHYVNMANDDVTLLQLLSRSGGEKIQSLK